MYARFSIVVLLRCHLILLFQICIIIMVLQQLASLDSGQEKVGLLLVLLQAGRRCSHLIVQINLSAIPDCLCSPPLQLRRVLILAKPVIWLNHRIQMMACGTVFLASSSSQVGQKIKQQLRLQKKSSHGCFLRQGQAANEPLAVHQ